MVHSKLHLAIASINILVYFCLTIYVTYVLIEISLLLRENNEPDGNPDTFLTAIGGILIAALVITLVMYSAMLIASIFLMRGIQRQQPKCIAPWIYMTICCAGLIVLDFIRSKPEANSGLLIKVVVVVMQAASWYPIYKLHRDLRNPSSCIQQAGDHTMNVNYCAQPGTGIYPPGAYGPQAGAGVYNSPSQPLYPSIVNANYNPTPNANYPRQATGAYSDLPQDTLPGKNY